MSCKPLQQLPLRVVAEQVQPQGLGTWGPVGFAMLVNWVELTITHPRTGEPLYHNAFVTNRTLTQETVLAVVEVGRARWKVENEHHNTLKTKGYHFEHNFGHGKHHLASFLLTLNLLAFLFHTVLALLDATYQQLRGALGTRQTFFKDIETLTRYLYFASWSHPLDFMVTQLEPALESP